MEFTFEAHSFNTEVYDENKVKMTTYYINDILVNAKDFSMTKMDIRKDLKEVAISNEKQTKIYEIDSRKVRNINEEGKDKKKNKDEDSY